MFNNKRKSAFKRKVLPKKPKNNKKLKDNGKGKEKVIDNSKVKGNETSLSAKAKKTMGNMFKPIQRERSNSMMIMPFTKSLRPDLGSKSPMIEVFKANDELNNKMGKLALQLQRLKLKKTLTNDERTLMEKTEKLLKVLNARKSIQIKSKKYGRKRTKHKRLKNKRKSRRKKRLNRKKSNKKRN